jgi:hypothetical protein
MTETAHAHEYRTNGDKCGCPFPACWWNSAAVDLFVAYRREREASQ